MLADVSDRGELCDKQHDWLMLDRSPRLQRDARHRSAMSAARVAWLAVAVFGVVLLSEYLVALR